MYSFVDLQFSRGYVYLRSSPSGWLVGYLDENNSSDGTAALLSNVQMKLSS